MVVNKIIEIKKENSLLVQMLDRIQFTFPDGELKDYGIKLCNDRLNVIADELLGIAG